MSPRRGITAESTGSHLESLLEKYDFHSDPLLSKRLRIYLESLTKWNARINLTASTSWENLGPMFEEALWADQFYPAEARLHLDIGSGAGFPALPIGILHPSVSLHLVESRERRSVFLEMAAAEMSLSQVLVFKMTLAEMLTANYGESGWDIVSWKALRVKSEDAAALISKSRPGTQFWLFHSRELPLEDPREFEGRTALIRREACPSRKGRLLSIYRRKV